MLYNGHTMPEETFYIGQNDTAAPITRDLKDAFGAPVNVTGASVRFSMRVKPAGTVKVDAASATVVNGGIGRVRYTFSATNTNTADEYEGEFEVTFSDGSIQTFPNRGYIPVVVQDDIG